jgi:hypothetical protein
LQVKSQIGWHRTNTLKYYKTFTALYQDTAATGEGVKASTNEEASSNQRRKRGVPQDSTDNDDSSVIEIELVKRPQIQQATHREHALEMITSVL